MLGHLIEIQGVNPTPLDSILSGSAVGVCNWYLPMFHVEQLEKPQILEITLRWLRKETRGFRVYKEFYELASKTSPVSSLAIPTSVRAQNLPFGDLTCAISMSVKLLPPSGPGPFPDNRVA